MQLVGIFTRDDRLILGGGVDFMGKVIILVLQLLMESGCVAQLRRYKIEKS
jgi:hypothetical protein